MNETRQYEETIDLLALMVQALRKWPVLLAAMLIGAVLLGGYKGLFPGVADNTDVIAAIQSQIDANLATIENNEKAIETNELSIKDNQKKITESKNLHPIRENQIAQWEELLDSLKGILKESQHLLTDLSIPEEQYAAIVKQINALTENILKVHAQIEAIPDTEAEIKGLESEIETIEKVSRILSKLTRNCRNKPTNWRHRSPLCRGSCRCMSSLPPARRHRRQRCPCSWQLQERWARRFWVKLVSS